MAAAGHNFWCNTAAGGRVLGQGCSSWGPVLPSWDAGGISNLKISDLVRMGPGGRCSLVSVQSSQHSRSGIPLSYLCHGD